MPAQPNIIEWQRASHMHCAKRQARANIPHIAKDITIRDISPGKNRCPSRLKQHPGHARKPKAATVLGIGKRPRKNLGLRNSYKKAHSG